MTGPFSVHERMDPRLGRRFVEPDPQNALYRVRGLLPTAVERKPTFWALPAQGFPLDQVAEGGCEAWGLAQELAAGPVVVSGMTNQWAHDYFQRVRATDRSLGYNFPDGATTQGNMKTAKSEGLITGYRWCEGLDDVVDTTCSVGPVCIGVDWFSQMYSTAPGGLVRVGGSVVGGHFITIVGYDVHPTWGPCCLWLNSWGGGYGVADTRIRVPAGIGWIPLPTLDMLLRRDADMVVPADFFNPPAPPRTLYLARRGSAVFHKSSCRLAPTAGAREFNSREAAVAAGLRPCWWCKP